MTTSRIRRVKVGLSNNSSTICVHPGNTWGALASNRNTLRLPRRAIHWRIGSGCSSMPMSGIRDISLFPWLFGGEGEGPVQSHERLVDRRPVWGNAGLVTHVIRLQRLDIREDRVATDVRIVPVEQLRDQRLVAVGVKPEVHMLRAHDGSVCGPHDFPARTVGGHRVIAGSDGPIPEPAVVVGGQQSPHGELVVQLLGLLNVVEALTVAVPGVYMGAGDRIALLVDDPTGDEQWCAGYAVGDVVSIVGRRTALDVERPQQSRGGDR